MARAPARPKVDRRKFLTGAMVAGAATAVTPDIAAASAIDAKPVDVLPPPSARRPSARVAAAEASTPKVLAEAPGPAGSDFMVDVIKSLGIEYIPSNPASSFRGLHESLINYGGTRTPEFITCLHEESSVAMAHGYFKVAGKPLAVLCHGTVGLQHATMAIYNAWCDRVPVIVHRAATISMPPNARRAFRPSTPPSGPRRVGARLHQVGRPAGVAAPFRRVVRARLQDRDDAALRAGAARRSTPRLQEEAVHRPRQAQDPALHADGAAAGRHGRGARGGEACWPTPSSR